MKKKFYNYDGCPVFLETAEYRNNDTLAVVMFSANGELYGDVTVNHTLNSTSDNSDDEKGDCEVL